MPHGDATLAVSSLGVILLLAGNAFAIVRGHYAPSLTSLTLVSAITLELCGPQSGGWLTQSHWSRMEVVMAVNAIFI
ncbi:MAG TPA: hypothetical protein VFN25_07880 [Dokdonella sp.]|uniref:hypothetical protein n=1 Tax=Dokdonella sp. TaxID=2291710 RepID=UPI002D804F28|nr:hypothetical protein [Dokdonella sp.]HET9032808.1 hypothetical protein [Dokdonella sp.]